MTCVSLSLPEALRCRGLMFCLSLLSGLMSAVSAIVSVGTMLSGNPETAVNAMFLIQPIGYLILALAGYFLSTYLMGKKLNLP